MAFRDKQVAALACVGLAAAAVHAQDVVTPAPGQGEPVGTIVVVGKRASLATAQEIKRQKLEIVDSVVAEDINKLPDISVTDAIQRVTGVQVARTIGDGTNVAIRGLTQIETTLNGREVFTAGSGRNLEYADIPAEMLAGIDVYKTSSADHIEGGIGGLVDLRTRRPFDFVGGQAIATVREIRGDLVDREKTQYSMLLSNRWTTAGAGEFGALLSVAVQDRAFREDQKTAGTPTLKTYAGQSVEVPNGTTETTSLGTRRRTGGDLVLQWRPTKEFDLYAEASHSELRTLTNQYQLTASPTGASTIANLTLVPGTNDAQSLTWNGASLTTIGAARDTTDRTSQFALGGNWTRDDLTLKADLSYTKSYNWLRYCAVPLGTTVPTLSQDLSGATPGSSVNGADISSFSRFTSAQMWYVTRPFDGNLKAARLDAEFRLGGNVIDSLSAGLRLARRHATDAPGQVGYFQSANVGNAASLVTANPIGNFLPGSTSIGGYLLANPDQLRNPDGLRQTLGIAAPFTYANALGIWDIAEETRSAYAMATIRSARVPLEGNVGVRLVQTRETVSGYVGSNNATATPLDTSSQYLDTLPSLNLRYQLAPRLYLRGAASKSLTRPDFLQMSPSITLNPVQMTAAAGNPALKPVRSDNVDLAIEWYFAKSSSVHLTAFTKKVDGFVISVAAPETIDGAVYQVTRPHNANTADIKGTEVGYQQFFDFLPGWLSGFGVQANYTYVASSTRDANLGQDVPLQNLSRNSYNLVLMYEKGPISARMAYNWRDKFLTSVDKLSFGYVPTYTKAYGWLDASLTYRLNARISISLEGLNLTRTVRQSYWGVESRPRDTWVNDRQIGATATIRF